ncbi:hypothetical protein [Adhaeribacter radiodurans]|uniref:Uncharacterized protein n=1 Tax=Adhaeribacter radiodurans TaxID=2745197 RepID=A0A7L7L4T6_9BACT|nr:hypothetical protein [Adhaeribacter radiodurans]QMU27784.1 hypothetical protein HUW48_06875 [Adhaeribacter radiodurans]
MFRFNLLKSLLQNFKYLFTKNKSSQPTCKRHSGFTGTDQEEYAHWLQQKTYLNWTPALFKSYHFDKAGIRPTYKLERIEQLGKQGVLFFFDDRIGEENFKFLTEFLKDQVIQLGYRLHSADIRTNPKAEFIETIYKYYFTPPPACLANSILCNQLYGNISIDLIHLNAQPSFIRIVANSYLSCAFSKPLPFDDLLDNLLVRPTEIS